MHVDGQIDCAGRSRNGSDFDCSGDSFTARCGARDCSGRRLDIDVDGQSDFFTARRGVPDCTQRCQDGIDVDG